MRVPFGVLEASGASVNAAPRATILASVNWRHAERGSPETAFASGRAVVRDEDNVVMELAGELLDPGIGKFFDLQPSPFSHCIASANNVSSDLRDIGRVLP